MHAKVESYLLRKVGSLMRKVRQYKRDLRDTKIAYASMSDNVARWSASYHEMEDKYRTELAELRTRIAQMAPEKQFEVHLQVESGSNSILEMLDIISVASCYGKTTITVARHI